MVERENTNFTMVDEFYQETQVRLLADKIRVHGVKARLADDQFGEYIGLDEKLNYIKDRIKNAKHVLANIKEGGAEYTPDVIASSRDYILNGSHFEHDKQGLVASFYHESKFKSANDELIEALQEFQIAGKGNSANLQVAKTEMAKVLFGLNDKPGEVLDSLANHFVQGGKCQDLINQLSVYSQSGQAKWDKAGALIIGAGKITRYCNTKLSSQDYEFSAQAGLQQIEEFVQKKLQKFVGKNKKSKFIAGNVVLKAINNLLQRIS